MAAKKSAATRVAAPKKVAPAAAKQVAKPASRKSAPKSPKAAVVIPVAELDAAPAQVLETATEQLGNVNEMIRQFAEAGMEQSQTAYDRLRDAADAASGSFEESTAATRDAGEKAIAAWIDSVNINSNEAIEAVQAISTAGSLPAAFEIWAEFGRKQFDTMTGKNEKVSSAFASYFETASKPYTELYAKGFAVT